MSALTALIATISVQVVQPHLVAIYTDNQNGAGWTVPEQVGTGFLIAWKRRPVLITAKHCLRGPSFTEDPTQKSVFVGGALTKVGQLSRFRLYDDPVNDLCAFYVDAFSLFKCLPNSVLSTKRPAVVTIHGYLGRDFKRAAQLQMLQPKPFIYTDKYCDAGNGYVGIRYPRHRALDTHSGMRVITPRPAGLSGCPMIETAPLAQGRVRIAGVFTDKRDDQGFGFGECASKVCALLASM